MQRTLISETTRKIGEKIRLAGRVYSRRDHGKLVFIDLQDRSGLIQVVVIPDNKKTHQIAKDLRNEYIVEIEGVVKEKPGNTNRDDLSNIEIEASKINVLSEVIGDLPVDISEKDLNVNLETLLGHRTLTLRNNKVKAIFRVYAEIIKFYAEILRKFDFLEIKTPKILSSATEGGANFFKIKYFDQDAFLAQSPQFYKQAGVGIFERVFEIGTVFRAEPHFTSRHINEYTSLDAEMGFINGFEDIMNQLEKVLTFVFDEVGKNCEREINIYDVNVPKIKTIPRMKLTEALNILEKEYKKKSEGVDIDPEGERLIGEWAKKKYDSDFIFLTHYPTKIRPFYTMPSKDPQYTESFDLIFRGIEIATGGQRIHKYDELLESIKRHKMNPKDFKHYLDIFRYGMPPHGGWGMGSERIVQKLLGLSNIKEAVLFPRDVKRLTP